MSTKVDMERRQHALEEGVKRGRDFAKKLTRMVELYAQGLTDAQVGQLMGKGFSRTNVKRLRSMMGIRLKEVRSEEHA